MSRPTKFEDPDPSMNVKLVKAVDICLGDRIVRDYGIAEVVHINDFIQFDTLELRLFSELRGYEEILVGPQAEILCLADNTQEAPSSRHPSNAPTTVASEKAIGSSARTPSPRYLPSSRSTTC